MFVSSVATEPLRARHHSELLPGGSAARLVRLFIPLLFLVACDAPPQTPAAPAPLRFVGSEACSDCHAEASRLWRESHHALAMQPARLGK